MTGSFPPAEIDHINKDRTDNHWENLRLATHGQNRQNIGAFKNNKLGVKGVSVRKRPGQPTIFAVHVNANGSRRRVYCRKDATLGEAADLYARLAKEMHGEFARTE